MRRLGRFALAIVGMLIASMPALAQTYPSRPIHFVVGFAAGGPNDIVARILGEWLSNHMGQQWVIENRAGSCGRVAAGYVAAAAPGGCPGGFVAPRRAAAEPRYSKRPLKLCRDTGTTRVPPPRVT